MADEFDLKVSRAALYDLYFTERFELDIEMPADLDQFR